MLRSLVGSEMCIRDSFKPEEVNFNYTEANAWQYSLFTPQDISGHIKLKGGNENYENHLDSMFLSKVKTTGRHQPDVTGLIGQYAHGNEPSHHMAYLYNYIGKASKTQKYVAQILNEQYSEKPDGLSGNEDCGQMSSWYVLSSLGFYPVTPGHDYYAIGTPLFKEATINLENNNSFKIKARNVSDKNITDEKASIPSALTVGAVHSHLIKNGLRGYCSLNVECSDVLDTHSFAVLIGVGATTINPYLALDSIYQRYEKKLFGKSDFENCIRKFKKSIDAGLLKICLLYTSPSPRDS